MQILRIQDANTGGDSSSQPAAQANDVQQQGAKGQQSPAGKDGQTGKDSISSVVQAVLDKHGVKASDDMVTPQGKAQDGSVLLSDETPKEPVAPSDEQKQKEEQSSADAAKKPTDGEKDKEKADDSKLPFHTHPRFQQIVREKSELETKVKELSTLEDPGKRMLNVEKFCAENNIPAEDYDRSLVIASLLNSNDPAKQEQGLTHLKQVVSALEVKLGKALPADLQKKVDDGLLSKEDAQEISTLRVQASSSQTRVQRVEQQTAEQRQAAIVQALDAWTTSKMERDPSFKDVKYEMVANELFASCQAKRPTSVADMVQRAEAAYDKVHKYLDSIIAKPQQRRVQQQLTRRSVEEQPQKVDISKPGWAKNIGRQVAANAS